MKPKIEAPIIPRHIPQQSVLGGDDHVFSSDGLEVDVYRLIHLTETIPVVEVSVEKLSGVLDEPCWSDGKDKTISPKVVMQIYEKANRNMEFLSQQYPHLIKQIQRIVHADLSHPIIVLEGRVVDGAHRLAKAILQGDSTIKAKVLESIPEEAILKKP